MNSTKLVTFFLSLAMLISCKGGDKDNQNATAEPASDPNYVITLNATIKKSDNIQLFFKETTDDNTQFSEENSVRVDVIGSDKAQDIVFKLPTDSYPSQLRLDLGLNKDQQEIAINNLNIQHAGKNFSLSAADFFEYFVPDTTYVNVSKVTKTVTPKVAKDGSFDPKLFSGTMLAEKLQTIK